MFHLSEFNLSKPRSPQVGWEEWDLSYAFECEIYPPKTPFFPPLFIHFIREQTLARALLLGGLTPPFFKRDLEICPILRFEKE